MKFYHDAPRVVFSSLTRVVLGRRLNRFAVEVSLPHGDDVAHLPNSGRLGELVFLGARAWVEPHPAPWRRTRWDLVLVEANGVLVSVDARKPNDLVAAALTQRALVRFASYSAFRREVRLGSSRFDLLLEGPADSCVMEVKSVTLVVDGVGRFPDAPTTRGARHARELGELAASGKHAAIVFVIQRPDVAAFEPNDRADPAFTEALRRAASTGAEVCAYRCGTSLEALTLLDEVPVLL